MTYPGQQPPPYQPPSGGPPPGYHPPPYQPSTPPAYAPPAGAPQYGAPQYGGQQYGTPQYGGQQYGTPPPAPAGPPRDTKGGLTGPVQGKHLLAACWNLLKQDRSLLMLPVLSAVFAFLALAIFFVPGLLFGFAGGSDDSLRIGAYAGVVLGGFAASVVSIFFQAALVIGANERADGGDPTVASTLAGAWERKGAVLGWAVVATVVGTLIRATERRGLLGRIVGFLGGIAWAIATFLAVPVVVAEGVGPIEAVKRSSAIIKQTWGLGLRSTLRFGLIQLVVVLPAVVLLVAGVVLVGQDGGAARGLGVVLLAIGLVLIVAMGVVFGAIGQYARAMLYRYATGRPVPGIDAQMMASAFAPKKRVRNRQRFA